MKNLFSISILAVMLTGSLLAKSSIADISSLAPGGPSALNAFKAQSHEAGLVNLANAKKIDPPPPTTGSNDPW